MGNAHSLKDEGPEDSAEGKHSPRRNIPQGDKEQRFSQGVNPSLKCRALYVGVGLGEPRNTKINADDAG